jgi:predicted regulator of Ras-like GTPase activity (Roadblock/LC7/MglB family)
VSAAYTTALEPLTAVRGVRGAMILSAAEGWVVASILAEELADDTAAALVASLVGRLARATNAAGAGAPRFVHLRARDGVLLAVPAGPELLVLAVADPEVNVGLARLELMAAAGRIA